MITSFLLLTVLGPLLTAKPSERRTALRHTLIVSLIAVAVFCLQLGNSRFWDQDEGYYASVASEMYQRGDWIVPTFNDELFAHKPPMMYWGMMLGFSSMGVSEFAARLPSALFGLGTALLIYWLARRFFDARTGLYAALALVSCFMFSVFARSATADSHLTFFVVLSFCIWARDAFRSHSSTPIPLEPEPIHIRWSTWVAAYAAMGLAVLSKGPIGVAFPVTILGCVHLLDAWVNTHKAKSSSSWRSALWDLASQLSPPRVLRTIWSMRPLTAIGVVALVSGPWFAAMQAYTDGHFLTEFLGVHHLNRFSQPMDNHSGPIFYYAIACLIGLYPWSAFAIPTALQWCKPTTDSQGARARLFVSAWIVVYLGVFSLASTKLPNYVAPAYPAFAIIIGYYMAQWSQVPSMIERRWQVVGWACLMGIGLAVIALPWALTIQTQSGTWLDRFEIDDSMQQTVRWISAIGIPLVVGGCFGLHLRLLNRMHWLAPCFSATAVATMLLFWQVIVPCADRHQTPQDIAASLQAETVTGDAPSIAVLSYFRPSMVFYAGRPIHFCKDSDELVKKLTNESAPILVLKESSLDELRSKIPAGYRIVQRHPEFPRRGSVLVLSPPVLR